MDRVRGGEEREHGILGYAGSILVDKVGPVVGLQGEREIVPGPLSRRTCIECPMVGSSLSTVGEP